LINRLDHLTSCQQDAVLQYLLFIPLYTQSNNIYLFTLKVTKAHLLLFGKFQEESMQSNFPIIFHLCLIWSLKFTMLTHRKLLSLKISSVAGLIHHYTIDNRPFFAHKFGISHPVPS